MSDCELFFQCNQKWEELKLTKNLLKRYCHKCQKEVVKCDSVMMLDDCIRHAKCVCYDNIHIPKSRKLPKKFLGSIDFSIRHNFNKDEIEN